MRMIVAGNVVNLYTAPDTDSELASQAVLGTKVHVTAEQNGFSRVTTEDRYESWIDSRLLEIPSGLDPDTLSTTIATLLADVYTAPDSRAELLTKLTVGTSITLARRPAVGDWVPISLPHLFPDRLGYVHRVSLSQTHTSQTHASQPESSAADLLRLAADSGVSRQDIVSALGHQSAEAAKRLIGTPYLWGGTTPFGIDCSGLTQLVYKLNGIQLLRDAALQFEDRRFRRVEEGQSLETAILDAGDLVAFSRREDQRPTHIGLALGDGRFLHARGGLGVRVDFCDVDDYGRTYLGAVRLSADADFAVESA